MGRQASCTQPSSYLTIKSLPPQGSWDPLIWSSSCRLCLSLPAAHWVYPHSHSYSAHTHLAFTLCCALSPVHSPHALHTHTIFINTWTYSHTCLLCGTSYKCAFSDTLGVHFAQMTTTVHLPLLWIVPVKPCLPIASAPVSGDTQPAVHLSGPPTLQWPYRWTRAVSPRIHAEALCLLLACRPYWRPQIGS